MTQTPVPDIAQALQRAIGHHRAGHLAEAAAQYRQILSAAPGQVDVHRYLGQALLRQGRLGEAIDTYVQALQGSERAELRSEFVQIIRSAFFQAPHAEMQALLVRALEEVWADPGELLTPATSLVEANPAVREGIARAGQVWGPALRAAIAADRLLLALLDSDAINSIALERLLTQARRRMLDEALAGAGVDPLLAFHAALARQCFINEYVYACSDHEIQQLAALRQRLDACLEDGTAPDTRWLVAGAAYAPLSQLPGAEAWSTQPWPAPLVALFVQQVGEPAIERTCRASIPSLTAIDDPVSRQVQAQYEQNPYPRWVRAARLAAPIPVESLLRHQFPGAPLQPVHGSGPLDVLVAGCGTGQHPIQVAQQFAGARVLAVDLSLASLCYAKRKTAELGLTNIEYAQADILRLGVIDRRFDLIESAGVLHHLADPVAGWRVLLELLRPGGLMLLGFYSELGRRDVVAARNRVASQVLPASASDIRLCRQALMGDELAPQFELFLASRDFYSTSACRDLLFHVQEHRYTLPQLKDILAQLRLNFIGFMLDGEAVAAYAQQFPDDPARTNLDHWHAFETARPDTFARMYQFWVQKPP